MLIYAADDPNYADLIEAYSTLGGALFTALAVIVAFVVWRHDQRLRREDQRDAESAQARLVFGNITTALGDPKHGWDGINFTVSNNSQAPIFNVRVVIETKPLHHSGYSEPIPRIPASTTDTGEATFAGSLEWPFSMATPIRHEIRNCADIRVDFMDSVGRPWIRFGLKDPISSRIVLRSPGALALIAEYLGIRKLTRSMSDASRRGRRALINWLEAKIAEATSSK